MRTANWTDQEVIDRCLELCEGCEGALRLCHPGNCDAMKKAWEDIQERQRYKDLSYIDYGFYNGRSLSSVDRLDEEEYVLGRPTSLAGKTSSS